MHKNSLLRQFNNYYIVGWISRQVSSLQMLSFTAESCSRINILIPYYFSFVLLPSYIAKVTAPNVGNTSLQAEIIDHLNHENFTTQLKLAAVDQHQKSASSSRTDQQFEEKRAIEKCFKCNLCDKQFDFLSRLQQHNLRHKNDKSFTCKLCDKTFKYLNNLKRHEEEHGKEVLFICNECGKGFKQRSNLKTHEWKHKYRAFKCDECGKLFNHLHELRIHTDGKLCQRYRCKLCNKTTQYLSELKKHEKKHREERLFLCDRCGKGFKEGRNLKRHERIHKGIKSIKCDECGKRFNRNDYLKKHKKTHRNSSKRQYSRASTLTVPTAKNISATAALIKAMISIAGL